MRRLVVTQHITVDGVIDGDGGWFDPTADTEQGRALAAMTREHAAASDGFLVGRVTFEEMRGFWPQRTDDETGVTEHLQRVEKHVVSRTLDDPGWEGTTVLRGGDALADEILALKDREGRDIVVTGSIALVHELLRLGLVDELRLIQHPVALGAGRRLVPDGVDLRLALAESRTFSEGAVLLRYLVEPVAGAKPDVGRAPTTATQPHAACAAYPVPMAAVEVRVATSVDLASLEPLLHRWGSADDPDEKVVRYRERLASNVDNPTHHVVVALDGDEVVGYAAAQDYGPALRQDRSIARMHDLWVSPTARGRGAGTALFDAVRDWAQREARIGMLQWQSSDVAVDFYRTLGLEADAVETADAPAEFALAVHLPGGDEA